VPAPYFDNFQILKAIDERQRQAGGRPLWINAQQLPEGTADGDAHAIMAAVWRAGSMGRRLVRRFLGRWLDGQLITGPDGELQGAP